MARTSSQGLPYWQFDNELFDDIKIVDLGDKFGPLGESVFFRILSIINKNDGYYAQINNQLILSIYKSVSSKWIKNRSVISDIIYYCGECGLFDVNLLSQNIITSRGIQRRWLYAKEKSRHKGYTTQMYWLLIQDIGIPYENEDKCNINHDKCNINSNKCNINSTKIREDKRREDEDKEFNHHHLKSILEVIPGLIIDCPIDKTKDYEMLATKIEESDLLIKFRTLKELHNVYDKAIIDYYKRYKKIKNTEKSSQDFGNEREYSKDDMEAIFGDIESEDKFDF